MTALIVTGNVQTSEGKHALNGSCLSTRHKYIPPYNFSNNIIWMHDNILVIAIVESLHNTFGNVIDISMCEQDTFRDLSLSVIDRNGTKLESTFNFL